MWARIVALLLCAGTTSLADPAAREEPVRETQPTATSGQGSEPQDAPTDAPLQETVVTATRLPRPSREVPATVVVLPREELLASPSLVIDSVLRTVPSVATFRRSTSLTADPTSQGLNLRGVGPSAVSRSLVLLDGVPVNDPFGGWVYWRSLPRLGLDRIEIVPGGASALYGNFALGGVVQLVSRRLTASSLEGELRLGSFTTASGAMRATGVAGPLRGALEVEGLSSGGFTPVATNARGAVDQPASSLHASVNGRVEADLSEQLKVAVRASHFLEDQNGGTSLTTASVRVTEVSARGALELGGAGSLALAVFGRLQDFRQQRARVAPDRASETLASTQRVPTNDQGASLVWSSGPLQLLGAHRLSAGLDGRRIEGRAEERSSIERTAGGRQLFGGLFVEDLYAPGEDWQLSAALRLDAWRNTGGSRTSIAASGERESLTFPDRDALQLSPRLGILRRLGERATLRASGWRAFRAPTLNELYRPFQVGRVVTAANEALRPETLWGGELGVELELLEPLRTRATVFWNELSEPITNVTLESPVAGADRERQNLGRARIRGTELGLELRPHRVWVLLAAYTFVEPTVVEAPSQPLLVGKDLPQDPRHRASLAVRFDDARLLGATLQVRWLGPQYEDDLNSLRMGGYVLVDALVSRRLVEGLEVFLTVENLFDRTYLVGRAGVDTVGPPFSILGGLRLAL